MNLDEKNVNRLFIFSRYFIFFIAISIFLILNMPNYENFYRKIYSSNYCITLSKLS